MLSMNEAKDIVCKLNPNKDDKVVSCIDYKDDYIFSFLSDDEYDLGVTMAVNKHTGEVNNYNISYVITEKLIVGHDSEFEKAYNSMIKFT